MTPIRLIVMPKKEDDTSESTRNVGSAKVLSGRIFVLSVFVAPVSDPWKPSDIARQKQKVYEAERWLKMQALRYGKHVEFEKSKDWQKYVDSKRLEITCGEAPYIVSRYDTTTADIIPVKERIGILDRKLRVVNENTNDEKEWIKWVYRAFESVYGYEFQGDNLLIARINLLITFVDYLQERWNRVATDQELKKITNIIVWNLWQMDGITGTVPFGKPMEEYQQLSLFDFAVGINDTEPEEVDCRIFDWRSKESITFRSIKEGNKNEI